ncbi:MAG TPA: PEP-CTERM-box response regulator transcription factor [Candidatus Acidoferrum sp.]|nr:PEP-CTERM-box response regulator transcription factor [Candidatus Acidoferrum sp.]
MNPKLLIVDDDEEIRTQMKWALAKDYEILLAENRASAVETFRSARPSVVLLDLGLPPQPGNPEEGLAALSELLAVNRLAKIIIVTGQSEKQVALRAIGMGATDFLCKPVETEEVRVLLKRCFYIADLEREHQQMQQILEGEGFEGMLGSSPSMQSVFDSIRKVATNEVPVLMLGESGTGKEMAARAIHNRSSRKNGPFVAINCSAIPETLLESELFGHEKGAYTGAHVKRIGRFEAANAGTLFLDEIGEINLPLQVKLLRFLQEQRIARLGGREEIQIDTRIITATNSDLKKGIASGSFREDLYYRLAVVQILMPPLRGREHDIPLLAQAFLQRFAAQIPKEGLTFGLEAVRAMNTYSWPGNVRELQNCVKRAAIMADGKRITVQDLGLSLEAGENLGTLKSAREAAERDIIQRALRKSSGKIAAAATELGISRPTLYELMEKLGLERS